MQDEVRWIDEKTPIAASRDLGDNLTAVQNLQKKHQVRRDLVHRAYFAAFR